jgi:hypothetical protein
MQIENSVRVTRFYTQTGFGPQGDAFTASFTEEFYQTVMRKWEAQINHYLRHAAPLSGDDL